MINKTCVIAILLLYVNFFSSTVYAALAYNSTLLMGSQYNNYWAWDISSDEIFSEDERTAIEAGFDGGITLGTTQDIGAIDAAWIYNNGVGYHYTQSPITIISDDYSGNVELDIYGFTMWWDDNHYSLDSVQNPSGILTCGNSCENGDSFSLEILASLPCADCFYRDRHDYMFHMEGTISSVPIPTTIWLFGSGLLGLVGFARRKV